MFGTFAALFSFMTLYGSIGFGLALFALIATTVMCIRDIKGSIPFARRVTRSFVYFVIGVCAAFTLAYITLKPDILTFITDKIHEMLNMAPKGALDVYLGSMNKYAIPKPMTEAMILGGFLPDELRARYLESFLKTLSYMLSIGLPGILLASSALTAVVIAGVGGRYALRGYPMRVGIDEHLKQFLAAGDEPKYVPLMLWQSPYQLTLGLIVFLITGIILQATKIAGGDVIFESAYALAFAFCRVIMAISLERRMARVGSRPAFRVIIILLLELTLGEYILYVGAISAIFGTRGIARQLIEKYGKNNDEGNTL
jgi:hypothetical protein